MKNTSLPIAKREELTDFQRSVNDLSRTIQGTDVFLSSLIKRVENIKYAINITPSVPTELMDRAMKISSELKEIDLKFNRDSNKPSVEETPPSAPTFNERLSIISYTHYRSTSNITQNERRAYSALISEFPPVLDRIKKTV